MNRNAVYSLAVLKANWDCLGHDYVENFILFAAEAIKQIEGDIVTIPDLTVRITQLFNITLPDDVLRTILKRMAKRGYVKIENRIYYKNQIKLSEINFEQVQQQVLIQYEKFIRGLKQHLKEIHKIEWSDAETENNLLEYLKREDLENIIANAARKGTLERKNENRYLISGFLLYIKEKDTELFGFFDTIIKGYFIASAVYFCNDDMKFQINQKFENTEIYFDTPFLLYALGYAGENAKAPCKEVLELCYLAGAKLRCFEHTIVEIKGILDACSSKINYNSSSEDRFGDILDYFIKKHLSSSDVLLLSSKLEKELESLHIEIKDTPEYEEKLSIDESAFEEELKYQINYRNPQALQKDIRSITSIYRLRKAHPVYSLEKSKAILITRNSSLVSTVKMHFARYIGNDSFPLCISDYVLTTLTWLKYPIKAPLLPMKRIIADCYAAMHPSDKLWNRYLAEVEKIRMDEQYKDEDIFLLRHSVYAKIAIMEITHGEIDALDNVTVSDLLDIIKDRIKSDVQAKYESESLKRKDAEKTIQDYEDYSLVRLKNIEIRANKYAKKATFVLKWVFIAVIALGTIYSTISWHLPKIPKVSLLLAQIIIAFMSVLSLKNGSNIDLLFRRVEVFFAEKIQKFIMRISA